MPNKPQNTLVNSVSFNGIGLHTGIECKMIINPSEENTGLFFTRTDLKDKPTILADIKNVVETNRGTVLQENNAKIHTVEHILSALYGIGIDNANIELSGPEPPILDGSALPFLSVIKKVGIKSQNKPKNFLRIEKHIRYKNEANGIEINILPHDTFKITFFMDYELPNFGLQYLSINDVETEFEDEIAPARTFGLISEIAYLMNKGLIRGGSLDNSVVFVDKEINQSEQDFLLKRFGNNIDLQFKNGSILNTEGLRFDNEPVRHKVLDLVGDFALLGKSIYGHVIAKKSGHHANIELVKELKKIIE